VAEPRNRWSHGMTSTEKKRLVRRYYEEVVNTGDVDRLAEFISPDYVEVHENVRHPLGLDGARQPNRYDGGRPLLPGGAT
jgi:hypothetical protein